MKQNGQEEEEEKKTENSFIYNKNSLNRIENENDSIAMFICC